MWVMMLLMSTCFSLVMCRRCCRCGWGVGRVCRFGIIWSDSVILIGCLSCSCRRFAVIGRFMDDVPRVPGVVL